MVDLIFFTVFISIGQEDGSIALTPSLAKIRKKENSLTLYRPKIFFRVYIYSGYVKPRPAGSVTPGDYENPVPLLLLP